MSKIEDIFHDYKYQKQFDLTFTDKRDNEFKAKPDLILQDTRNGSYVYVELKEHPLNSITSLEVASNRLRDQCKWRRVEIDGAADHTQLSSSLWKLGFRTDCLKFGWNHSVYKHAVVAEELAKHDMRYMVVFSQHAATVGAKKKPFKLYYQQKGIKEVLLEGELTKLIESGILVKATIH